MIDERHLRNAFGSFGTGVAVVTLNAPDPLGLTINSLASVSLTPPLLSWCLATGSELIKPFSTTTHFGMSVLAADQKLISQRLALQNKHGLEEKDYELTSGGLPRIRSCLAHFDCAVQDKMLIGDHTMFIGSILSAHYCGEGRAPLFYFRGQYTSSL